MGAEFRLKCILAIKLPKSKLKINCSDGTKYNLKSNEDIKRVVNKYLNENNVYVYDLQINIDKKRWYFQFMSFVAHNTFMRFWNPFIDG